MRISRLLTGLVAVVGLLLVGVGSASAWDESDSTLFFDGTSPIVSGRAEATQRGDDPFDVTGYVDGTMTLSGGLVTAAGPVLCADIRGNTAGGFFRIEKSSVPGIVGMDMYLTAVDGGTTGDRLAAGVPVPAGSMTSCAPQPAIALGPVTSGELTIKDGELGDGGEHSGAKDGHDGKR